GGAQDNAISEQSAAGSTTWNINLCCDGGPTFVDSRTTPGFSYRYLGRDALESGGLRKKVYDSSGNLIQFTDPALACLREHSFLIYRPEAGATNNGVDPLFMRWYYAMELNAVDGRRLLFGLANGVFESTDQGETIRRIGTNTIEASAFSRMVYGGTLN